MPSSKKRAARKKRNPVAKIIPAIKKTFRAKAAKIPIETTTTTTVTVRPRQPTPKKLKGRCKQLEPAKLRSTQRIKGRKKGFKQHLKNKVTNIGQHFKRRGSSGHDQPIYYEIPRVMPNRAFDIGWRPRHALNIPNADDDYVLADPDYDAVLDCGHGTAKTSADVVVHRGQAKRKKTPHYCPVYENVGSDSSELFYDHVPKCAPPKLPVRRQRSKQDVYYVVMK